MVFIKVVKAVYFSPCIHFRLQGSVIRCETCKGRGVRIEITQIGPGMVQQMQSTCNVCRGEGEVIPSKDRCKKCDGKKKVTYI